MSTVLETRLLTAEEYLRIPDDGRMTELVRGRIVTMNRPFTSHGYYCTRVTFALMQFVEQHGLGRVVSNDAGVITQRGPDTVRGPDVAFYSYQRVARGPLPEGYWPASPELAIEIRSPDDRWKDVLQKTAEYLNADVLTVAVIDPVPQRVHVFSADRASTILNSSDLLTFPDVLPGFEVPVSWLFE